VLSDAEQHTVVVRAIDLMGRGTVLTQTIMAGRTHLDVTALAAGLYAIEIAIDGATTVYTLTVL
jgi:hypothetical protein